MQTLKDFEVTDGIFFGNTPKKLAAQLSKLDDSSINIEYLERINKIAERNYNNAKKFTERHEILYKSSVKVKSWWLNAIHLHFYYPKFICNVFMNELF